MADEGVNEQAFCSPLVTLPHHSLKCMTIRRERAAALAERRSVKIVGA